MPRKVVLVIALAAVLVGCAAPGRRATLRVEEVHEDTEIRFGSSSNSRQPPLVVTVPYPVYQQRPVLRKGPKVDPILQ
jgi:hypothetical protein